MKMLRKKIHSKNLGNSQENHDGVWFSKVASLQFKYCNPTLNITTNSFWNKFGMA